MSERSLNEACLCPVFKSGNNRHCRGSAALQQFPLVSGKSRSIRGDPNVQYGNYTPITSNWSAHADKQYRVAASRRMLLAGGLRR